MATSWNDADVQCPFFVRAGVCGNRNTITCEGVTEESTLQWRFRSKMDCRVQMRAFCEQNHEKCEVFQMLSKAREE